MTKRTFFHFGPQSIALGFAMLLSACAANQLPPAQNLPTSPQHKVLVAQHWRWIAEDAAQRTRMALAKQGMGAEQPIYVVESAKHDFDKAFRKFLIAQLIENGATVVTSPMNAIEVKYEAQVIRHGKAIDTQANGYTPGMLLAGVSGFWILRDVFRDSRHTDASVLGSLALAGGKEVYDAKYPTTTPVELILTTSIVHQHKYLMLNADAYYIEKGEELLFEACATQRRRCREVK